MKLIASFIASVLFPVLSALAGAPVLAQDLVEEVPSGTVLPVRDNNSLYSGAYEVTKNGALIHGGDTVYQCEDLVRLGAPAKPESEEPTINGTTLEPLTRKAVGLCAEAGFPPEGAITDVSAPSNVSATTGASEAGSVAALPQTKGVLPIFPAIAVPVTAGVLLVLRTKY